MKTHLPRSILAVFFATALFTLTGCIKTLVDNTIEEGLEESGEEGTDTNVDLDIDFNNGTARIEEEGTVYEAGEDLEWPDNFPIDVPKVTGMILSTAENSEEGGYWVSLETGEGSMEELRDFYETELTKEGWEITESTTYGYTALLEATKDGRDLTIMFAPADSKEITSLVISEGLID